MSRAHIHTTSTGLQIGGHYIPRPPALSSDEERLQKALIEKRNRDADILVVVVSIACIAALILILK